MGGWWVLLGGLRRVRWFSRFFKTCLNNIYLLQLLGPGYIGGPSRFFKVNIYHRFRPQDL